MFTAQTHTIHVAVPRATRFRRGFLRFLAAAIACTVIAGGALGGTVSPAAASSLAYVKDGAVWVSAPDGSDAHEVGMGLMYPALADNGTVYALTATGQVDVLPPGVPMQSPISINRLTQPS